jgi:type III secretion protein T
MASFAGMASLVDELMAQVAALGLAALRWLGVFAILPLMTRVKVSGVVRGGAAAGLGLPAHAISLQWVRATPFDQFISYGLHGAKEFLIGMAIGFLISLPFWAVQAAGELIEGQRSISGESHVDDPASHDQVSATALLLHLAAGALFVASGGLNLLARLIYDSYAIWPLSQYLPKIDAVDSALIYSVMTEFMTLAAVIAGPAVVLLLISDLAVLILARATPQLSAYDLAPMLKNILLSIFLAGYLSYLLGYLQQAAANLGMVEQRFRALAQ